MSIHRERAAKGWSYWQGSPSDIADLARKASELVGVREDGDLKITVHATGWQEEYQSADEFLEDVRPATLGQVNGIKVAAHNATDSREITVAFKRTSQATGDTVVVSVVDPEREGAESAAQEIGGLIDPRSSRGAVPWWITGVGAVFFFLGLLLTSAYDTNPLSAIGIASAGLGGVAFVVGIVDSFITPVFEFVPDGQPKRRGRALHTGRRVVWWIADRAASGAIEFGLGVFVTVLYFRFFK